ncbi:MAG: hypothetical protein M1834_006139 [Cirrosporium novae-zelandiae]|nr:MAG: hypothetical protein M1834_006139 [Cirrosporium novae-zelandiae]
MPLSRRFSLNLPHSLTNLPGRTFSFRRRRSTTITNSTGAQPPQPTSPQLLQTHEERREEPPSLIMSYLEQRNRDLEHQMADLNAENTVLRAKNEELKSNLEASETEITTSKHAHISDEIFHTYKDLLHAHTHDELRPRIEPPTFSAEAAFHLPLITALSTLPPNGLEQAIDLLMQLALMSYQPDMTTSLRPTEYEHMALDFQHLRQTITTRVSDGPADELLTKLLDAVWTKQGNDWKVQGHLWNRDGDRARHTWKRANVWLYLTRQSNYLKDYWMYGFFPKAIAFLEQMGREIEEAGMGGGNDESEIGVAR